jgi:hypothetical protein
LDIRWKSERYFYYSDDLSLLIITLEKSTPDGFCLPTAVDELDGPPLFDILTAIIFAPPNKVDIDNITSNSAVGVFAHGQVAVEI